MMIKKRYVVEENWCVCTDGQIQQPIVVNSQSTVFVFAPDKHKKVATELDRMKMNFNCAKLLNAAALVGTIAGAIAGAALGFSVGTRIGGVFGMIGSMIGGVVGTFAGGFLGAIAGSIAASMIARKLINTFMPCFCAMLTRPFPWSSIHERVFPERPRALMPDAMVPCQLGGVVSLAIPDMEMAIKVAMACMYIYCDEHEDDDTEFDNYKDEGGQSFEYFEEYNPEKFGWKEVPPHIGEKIAKDAGLKYEQYDFINSDGSIRESHYYFYDKDTGYKAGLYETPDGDYALIVRGTHNSGKISSNRDWGDDNLNQAFLGQSDQYDQEADVAYYTRKHIDDEGSGARLITGGHSLGGGEATLGAAVGQSDESYTFNAAGINDRMLGKHNKSRSDASHVYTFSSSYDPLTFLDDNVWMIPNLAGKRIVLDIEDTPVNSLKDLYKILENGHDLPYLIDAMKKIPIVKVYALND